MPENKQMPLNKLESGQSGKIVEIQGGEGIINRLNALNIRPGQRIIKISSMFMRGPVTIEIVNGGRVAIGYGMARRIIVE
jgi:Fe2+ transport system protein FeoA